MAGRYATAADRAAGLGRRWLAALVLVPQLGCLVKADYEASSFRCSGTEACPESFTCQATRCVRLASDGGPGDAGCAASFAAPPDDFQDGVASADWATYTDTFSAVVERDGQLWVTPAMSRSGERLAGIRTQATSDARGRVAAVEVVTTTASDTAAITFLRLWQDELHFVGVAAQQGQLMQWSRDGAGLLTAHAITFDPVAHRHWAMAEAAGQLVWSTSPDGVSWTERGRSDAPAYVGAVRVDVGAGTLSAVDLPGVARFDQLNLRGPCP
jgi:hypothetical protein